jgi:D-alanyl-D-alanine carboxypeptidase/D-alanyl-D-alanine-endopeptidase (penicillin-binding protein 4)
MKGTALLALALASSAFAGSIGETIERLLASSPVARTAFWGIQVADLQRGKILYECNAHHLFIPASNTKLFTTALALERLGAGYTFETRVLTSSLPDPAGRIPGSLTLAGGGDPNLSGRAIPYQADAPEGDPLRAIQQLADQIAARGVKRVEGDIIGDDTRYLWQPYAPGWAIEDAESEDGPPVSALSLNDNVQVVRVQPGAHQGDLAAISLEPTIEYYQIDNQIRTTVGRGERYVDFERVPGSRRLRLWGTIPLRDPGIRLLVSIEDPAEYAALALRQALEDRGIVVEGRARAKHRYASAGHTLTAPPEIAPKTGIELARLVSAPLVEDLRITNKVSQNLHAELALRAVAYARRKVGSFEAGIAELQAFLEEIGIPSEAYEFHDGSGLARLNLVTPAAVVHLLRYMAREPRRAQWLSLLPVAAVDGTLRSRFVASPVAGKVHAKTGTLSHVSALSGYIERRNGQWVAFSILANNYHGQTADVRGVMDQICTLIWK